MKRYHTGTRKLVRNVHVNESDKFLKSLSRYIRDKVKRISAELTIFTTVAMNTLYLYLLFASN